MPPKKFDLLTIGVSHQAPGDVTLRGILAEQPVDLRARHGGLLTLAAALARLARRSELGLLGLEIEANPATRQITGRATGLLAPLLQRRVRELCSRVNKLGRPIALREGGFVYTLYQPPIPSTRMINHLARVILEGRHPPRPTTCTLQVTSRCQLDCYHCSAARYKSRERPELTTEQWRDVIRQAEHLGVNNIVFTGGEPLLRPDIFELIAAVDPGRANVALFTNGLLLTDQTVARLKDAGLFSLMVSLDDVRPEKHDELRRIEGGFARTSEGIRRALAGGLLVGISTYAGPDDVREGRVEQMIEYARELGVHEITIFDTVPTGKLLPLDDRWLLTEEDKREIIRIEREYNAREGYPHVVTQAFINGPDGAGCFAGYIQFYVTAYGDVNPCDFTPLTFGNLLDEPLADIWRRLLQHPAYCKRSDHCRMQDPAFRSQYIDHIPDDVLLPWPAGEELLEHAHCPQKCAAGCAAGIG